MILTKQLLRRLRPRPAFIRLNHQGLQNKELPPPPRCVAERLPQPRRVTQRMRCTNPSLIFPETLPICWTAAPLRGWEIAASRLNGGKER